MRIGDWSSDVCSSDLNRYWDVSFADRSRAKPAELEEELVALMQSAVRSRMVADVPLGAFLSGGVDSSAVVALMAEASKRAVNTCTIGFHVDTLDETENGRTSGRERVGQYGKRPVGEG